MLGFQIGRIVGRHSHNVVADCSCISELIVLRQICLMLASGILRSILIFSIKSRRIIEATLSISSNLFEGQHDVLGTLIRHGRHFVLIKKALKINSVLLCLFALIVMLIRICLDSLHIRLSANSA